MISGRQDRYLAERQRETLGDIDRVRARALRRRRMEQFETAVWIIVLAAAFWTLCDLSMRLFEGMFR